MFVKQLSVFVENKQGALSDVVALLSENGINMRAISIADTQDFGVLRMIVQDCEKAKAVLKAEKVIVAVNEVVAVELADKPGALSEVLKVLSGGGVNVEYMYAFLGGKDVSHAYMIFRVEDPASAESALTKQGIHVVNQDEMDAL